ncbi:MAG: hypothetical protein ACYC4Q_03615 [Victivallaceae bacterium]
MTDKKNIVLMLVLLAVSLLCLPGELVAESSFTVAPGLSVEFKKFDDQYFKTMEHFKRMDAVVSRLIKSRRASGVINCRIFITPEVKGKTAIQQINDLVTLSLNNEYETWKDDCQINRYLLSTIILCRLGLSPEENFNVLPQWLLAGMMGMIRQKQASARIIDVQYMPGLRALALEGKIPELKKIISKPLYPESDGAAYEFYEEICSFMVKKIETLSGGSEHILNDIIFLSAKKKYTPDEVFNTTVVRVTLDKYFKNSTLSMSDDEKFQLWFEASVREKVLSPFNPFSAAQIKEKVAGIRKVTCKMKTGGKEPREETFDILDLPEKLPSVENKNAVLLEKSRTMDLIQNACPQPLMAPVSDLSAALNDIGNKSSDDAREHLAAALNTLGEELKKQEAIENYLIELENKQISPALIYNMEIKEVNRTDDVMWPSLNKYLETVEKKFLED